jgi:hypothetical protein
MRLRESPEATTILNGRVFEVLGAVKASVKTWLSTYSGIGVFKKSRVLLRDAKNSEI